jgi:hypothetical protein
MEARPITASFDHPVGGCNCMICVGCNVLFDARVEGRAVMGVTRWKSVMTRKCKRVKICRNMEE